MEPRLYMIRLKVRWNDGMKKLKLPEISKPLPKAKRLSMDQYVKFVLEGRLLLDRQAYRNYKRRGIIGRPFTL